MKISKFGTLILGFIIIQILIVSPTFVAAQKEELKDKNITNAIQMELFDDEEVAGHLIDIDTEQGVVTLSGSVNNILAKERAEDIAQAIKGVRSVVNNIEVEPIIRSDYQILKDVVDALMIDPATESFEIDVEVNNGVVTLEGTVESYAEKNICAEVVKGVKGVRDINNEIDVSYEVERPDNEIESEIEKRLKYDVWVDDKLITVNVEDGNVILKGTVGSAAEKERAEANSWIAGVKSIDSSNLTVEWWARDEMKRKQEFADFSDQEIKKAVKDAFLFDPRVWSFPIEVEVSNGVVTLTGKVDNLKAKKAAKNDAKNTVGVWRVKNRLKVRPETYLTDTEIAANVKEALSRDAYVERYEIMVSVQNSKVYLYGTVDLSFEKERAEEVASRVKGVVAVKNNIRIKPEIEESEKTDWEIQEDIESELFWSPYVDSDEITVTVDNGVATLRGTVDTWSELNHAVENAIEGGAVKVTNKLKVNYGPDYY